MMLILACRMWRSRGKNPISVEWKGAAVLHTQVWDAVTSMKRKFVREMERVSERESTALYTPLIPTYVHKLAMYEKSLHTTCAAHILTLEHAIYHSVHTYLTDMHVNMSTHHRYTKVSGGR